MGVHIVLFLKQNTNIDFQKLATDLYNSYKEIKRGIIIEKKYNNPNEPNFIFNNNKDILIEGNNHHIAINLYNDYTKIKDDIIELLWDAFDYNDLEFIKVGYITEYKIEKSKIKEITESLFKLKEIIKSNEFQFGYHTILKKNNDEYNCWKRYIKINENKLIINYDINTTNTTDVNYKYLKEFINYCDKHINNEIKDIVTSNN